MDFREEMWKVCRVADFLVMMDEITLQRGRELQSMYHQ